MKQLWCFLTILFWIAMISSCRTLSSKSGVTAAGTPQIITGNLSNIWHECLTLTKDRTEIYDTPCNSVDPLQRWSYDGSSQLLSPVEVSNLKFAVADAYTTVKIQPQTSGLMLAESVASQTEGEANILVKNFATGSTLPATGDSSSKAADFNKDVQLQLGETAWFGGDEQQPFFEVIFNRVISDQRCPASAFCLVGLPAKLEILGIEAGTRTLVTFEYFDLSAPIIKAVGSYKIELKKLEPYQVLRPDPSSSGDPLPYVITFKVTK